MATKQTTLLQGRAVQIVRGDYGGDTVIVGTPEQPRPTAAPVRSLDKPAVLKKFHWDEAAFADAQRFAFPVAAKRPRVTGFGWDLSWKEDALDAWATDLGDQAAEMLRLIGRK